jgi:acetyl esterase/lipase
MLNFFKVLILLLIPVSVFSQEGYIINRDVVYGHKAGLAMTYDVIRPSGDLNGAGIIHVVSGAWNSRYYPPDSIAMNYKSFLDRGYTVFALRHGSSPQFTIPQAVSDVESGVWQIHHSCGAYGVDSTRLGIYGGSSGGQLALMAALSGEHHPVAAVVAFFAPANLQNVPELLKAIFPALNMDSTSARAVSPVLLASPDDPPTLLIHGKSDFIVAPWQSENMYKALQDNGVASRLVEYDGMGHGNTFGAKGEYYEEANSEMLNWFEKYLIKKQ